MGRGELLSHVARGQRPLPRQLMPRAETVFASRVTVEARRVRDRIVMEVEGVTGLCAVVGCSSR